MNISEFLIDIYKKQAKGNLTVTEETLLDALDMGQFLYFTVEDTANSKTYYYAFPGANFEQNVTFGDLIGVEDFHAYNADCPVLTNDEGLIIAGNGELQTQAGMTIQETDYLLQDGNLVNTSLYMHWNETGPIL